MIQGYKISTNVSLKVQEQEETGQGCLRGRLFGRRLEGYPLCFEADPGQNDQSVASSPGVLGW